MLIININRYFYANSSAKGYVSVNDFVLASLESFNATLKKSYALALLAFKNDVCEFPTPLLIRKPLTSFALFF